LFLTNLIKYPQLNVELTISFNADDFNFKKDNWKLSDTIEIKKSLKGGIDDAKKYNKLSEILLHFNINSGFEKYRNYAKELYIKKLFSNPKDSSALNFLARYYTENMQWNLSKEYFTELTKYYPDCASGWEGLAMISMINYDINNAYKNIIKAITIEPNNISLYCSLSNIMMYKAFSDISQKPDSVIDKMKYYEFIDFSIIDDAIKKNPKLESFKMIKMGLVTGCLLIEVFAQNSEMFLKATDSSKFKISQSINSELINCKNYFNNSISGEFKSKKFPYECLMITEFLQNNGVEAYKYFEDGLKNTKNNKSLYATMVSIYAFLWEKQNCINVQLELNNKFPTAQNYLLTAYFYYALNNIIESEKWTLKALDLDKNNPKGLLGITAIYLKQNKARKAEMYLKKYEKTYHSNDEYLFYRALFYLMNNSPVSAKSTFISLQKNTSFGEYCTILLNKFYKN